MRIQLLLLKRSVHLLGIAATVLGMGACTAKLGAGELLRPDAGGESAISSLGLTARLHDKSTEATKTDCARLETSAQVIASSLGDTELLGSDERAALKAKVSSFVLEFGTYESLLFGEVHRIREQALADGVVSDIELRGLARALDTYARLAGVSKESRAALYAVLTTIPDTKGPGQVDVAARIRKHRTDLVVQVANLSTDLQRCAPIDL